MKTEVLTILDHQDIQNKIRRIAYQIYESNVDEKEIILAGVVQNGYVIAERLKVILEEVSDRKEEDIDLWKQRLIITGLLGLPLLLFAMREMIIMNTISINSIIFWSG